jgi:hypothetical protein
MNRRLLITISVLIVVSMMTSGCVFLLAGAATGAGGYAWAQGKLTFTTSHTVTQCHDAAISTLKSLEVYISSDQTDKLAGRIRGKTATGDPVTIDLEPQEGNVTKVDIRVGYIGDKIQSQKIADDIRRRLN